MAARMSNVRTLRSTQKFGASNATSRIVSFGRGAKESANTKWLACEHAFKDSLPKLCLPRHLLVQTSTVIALGSNQAARVAFQRESCDASSCCADEDERVGSGALRAEFDARLARGLKLSARNDGRASWGHARLE